jgi:hypothetical protein
VIAACGGPDDPPETTVSPGSPTTVTETDPPATTPTGPTFPVGPTLVVDPLVIGVSAPVVVGDATTNVGAILWTGTFGGFSCPPELQGACLSIGGATVAASGSIDPTGSWVTAWIAQAGTEGSYVVFVATTDDGYSTLPVMRRVWATLPNWAQWEPVDLLDPANDGYSTFDATELGPGDWMDLGLDGAGDAYDIFAWGNQRVVMSATFHRFVDLIGRWPVPPPASEDALLEHTELADPVADVSYAGRSLANGSWTLHLQDDYGQHAGIYDLSIRIETPTEPRDWYADEDGDNWGDPDTLLQSPIGTADTVYRADDCDDAAPDVNPDAWDTCEDGIDHDCTGTDKPCRGAPLGEGTVETFSALRGDLYHANNPFDVAPVGDADGDGVAELWLRDNGGLSVLETPPGPEMEVPGFLNEHGWGSTREGDFDHDGFSDIAYGGGKLEGGGGAVLIAESPFDPTLIESAAWATLVGSGGDVGQTLDSAGDVDGDGFRDLLVGADEIDTVWILTSVPAGHSDLGAVATATLAPPASFTGEVGVHSAAADYDGDGLSDVTVGTDEQTAYVVKGPVIGTLDLHAVADSTLTLPGDLRHRLSIGDTDGDGVDELLLASGDAAWLFEAPPTGSADETDAASVVTSSTGVIESHAIGDLDGDGNDDVAIADPVNAPVWDGVVWLMYGPLPSAAELPLHADLVLLPSEDEGTGSGVWFVDADGDGGDDLVIDSGDWSIDVLYGLP